MSVLNSAGLRVGAGALAVHPQHQQPDRQAGERGERAGRRGETVGGQHRMAGQRLNVADIARHADDQAHQGGRPRPDPLPCGPAVQVGDIQRQLAHGEEHVDLGGPGHRLPAGQPVMQRPRVQAGVAVRPAR